MSPDGPVLPSLGRTDAPILVELLIRAGDERKRSVGLHLAGVDLAVCMSSSAATVEVSCMPTTPPASVSTAAAATASSSASEVTTLWRYTTLFIIIIVI